MGEPYEDGQQRTMQHPITGVLYVHPREVEALKMSVEYAAADLMNLEWAYVLRSAPKSGPDGWIGEHREHVVEDKTLLGAVDKLLKAFGWGSPLATITRLRDELATVTRERDQLQASHEMMQTWSYMVRRITRGCESCDAAIMIECEKPNGGRGG